jgi:acyl-CoA synthetase (NDP forming)
VDVTAQAIFKIGYTEFARLVAASPEIDGVMVVSSTRRARHIESEREKLIAFGRETSKPVFFWTYTLPAPESTAIFAEAGYPLFTNVNSCARAMQAMVDYRTARERFLRSETERPQQTPAGGHAPAGRARVLCEWEARLLLARHGIGGDAGILARSAEEAGEAARTIGRPLAMKVQSPDIPHKTEAGAVALDVATPREAQETYGHLVAAARRHAPDADILGVLAQPMAPPGREVMLGISHDATWGPMLMVGHGGILVEALDDVALAPVPLTRADAHALLANLKGARLFAAHRGTPAADVEALIDLMVALSRFAVDHADTMAEIDLNPIIVHEKGQGASIVDALIVTR